ncbi:MAG: metallopeptidase family protein [Terrimicrobiaceae bacterium]|nr:metallopeptidase family protein [Terrimicrobiaceae bacterium]
MRFSDLLRIAEEQTTQTLAELPPEIRREIANVPVVFEPRPNAPDLDPDLLGLYDPGLESAPAPRIILWLDNLWEYAGENQRAFRAEIRQTLLHEIGHHLGWTEDDLEARGLD